MFASSAKAAALVVLALSVTLAATPAARSQNQAPPPAAVQVATARSMEMAPMIDLPGTVISRNDARIATEVTGRVEWVAEVGTTLKQGDAIAKLDNHLLLLQAQDNEATVKRLEARLGYESRQTSRLRELAATNTTPAQRVDEAEANMEMTAQELASARVALERTKILLERAVIRAPFPGRVVERLIQVGEYANVGTDVARVVDTQHLEVRIQAPITISPFLSDGQSVVVKDGGTSHEHPIRTIVAVGDEITRTMEVRVSVPAGAWVIGTPVRVSLPSAAPRQVTAVDRDALILRRDETYIFKISEEGAAERVAVRTGSAAGQYIEVIGPVSDGERVVVRGGERLQPGQAVQVLDKT